VKICHVIRIKFNELIEENVHVIINLPTKRVYVTADLTNISKSFTHNMAVAQIWNEITPLSPYI